MPNLQVKVQLLGGNAKHSSYKVAGHIYRHKVLRRALSINNGTACQSLPYHLRRQEHMYKQNKTQHFSHWQHECNIVRSIYIDQYGETYNICGHIHQSCCLTLGEFEDPVKTMSTEEPGKSSTREGLRLNTVFSLPEGTTSPWPRTSFLAVVMGGKTVRPDKFPVLQVCEVDRELSVRQYNLCICWPWLVSLKWYWHDPGLSKMNKEVRHTVRFDITISL